MDTHLYKSDPLSDFLWADPDDNNEEACFNESRQTSCLFGANGLERFLRLNDYKLLIRSHTSCPDGYMANLGGKCITIFSVPKYIDDNKGACIAMWGQENKTLCGVIVQYSVSDQSAMDNQVFCSEALIQKFNSLDV